MLHISRNKFIMSAYFKICKDTSPHTYVLMHVYEYNISNYSFTEITIMLIVHTLHACKHQVIK